jgi:phage terminase large subunit
MQATANNIKLRLPMVHKEILNFKEKYTYCYGGRGGGKSKTVARVIVTLAIQHPKTTWLVTRKSGPALEVTAKRDVLDAIAQIEKHVVSCGLMHEAKSYYEFDNGSRVYFLPLYISQNRNERLKSMDLNGIWYEEPTECTKADYDMLFPCTRLPGLRKVYFTFNPPESSDHWLYKLYARQYAQHIAHKVHFAIEDNPLLPEDVVAELDQLKEIDAGLYERFRKGTWGIDVKRKRVWTRIFPGGFIDSADAYVSGADFGWSSPSSWHLYGIKDDNVYMIDEIYRTHLQPEDFAALILDKLTENKLSPRVVPVIADSEAPEKIAKLREAGLWVIGYKKYKGCVNDGIIEVRRHEIYVDDEKCPFGYRDLTNYIYPLDRDGNVQEEPLKLNDHACDDMRMAIHAFYKRLTQRPSNAVPQMAASHF